MGPSQYVRMLVTFIFLSQTMLRNKIFQTSLNLIGTGSNGKSQFVELLSNVLGDKMVYITTKTFFNTVNELRQMALIDEEAFMVYDVEATEVDAAGFKTFVTDTLPPLCRKLYRSVIDRGKKNLASALFCSNYPLKYYNAYNNLIYDGAFHRRVIIMPFYNILGKKVTTTTTRSLLNFINFKFSILKSPRKDPSHKTCTMTPSRTWIRPRRRYFVG
jgi:phage/plasmid-associated DNA primase